MRYVINHGLVVMLMALIQLQMEATKNSKKEKVLVVKARNPEDLSRLIKLVDNHTSSSKSMY